MTQLFFDMDGVLADTATHFRNLFGREITWTAADFPFMRQHGQFYRDQPLMPGAIEMWDEGWRLFGEPRILTGIPDGVPYVPQQKQSWARHHFGDLVQMIGCASDRKSFYGKQGDILVDDRAKYRDLWMDMGGIFLQFRSVEQTISELQIVHTTLQQRATT